LLFRPKFPFRRWQSVRHDVGRLPPGCPKLLPDHACNINYFTKQCIISVYTLSCIVMCEFGIVAVSGYLLCGKNKFFTYLVITRGEVTPKVALWLAYKPITSSSTKNNVKSRPQGAGTHQ